MRLETPGGEGAEGALSPASCVPSLRLATASVEKEGERRKGGGEGEGGDLPPVCSQGAPSLSWHDPTLVHKAHLRTRGDAMSDMTGGTSCRAWDPNWTLDVGEDYGRTVVAGALRVSEALCRGPCLPGSHPFHSLGNGTVKGWRHTGAGPCRQEHQLRPPSCGALMWDLRLKIGQFLAPICL